MTTESLRYPIGRFSPPNGVTPSDRERYMGEIERLPATMRDVVVGLTDEQLNTPYREGGWTLRQVVHHVPDSHTNSYIRYRWTLTEDQPTIKAYYEARWGELPDASSAPIEPSLQLLKALHQRWLLLLRAMNDKDYSRSFLHPETNENIRLDTMLAMYAWHGKHHVAHIQSLKDRMGW
ncbi:MAG: YfiT family bacillithiol transferase [Bacteroidota bacterium]